MRVGEGDVEGFDARGDGGEDGGVDLAAAEAEVAQPGELREQEIQVRGGSDRPLQRYDIEFTVGEDHRRWAFRQGVGACGMEAETGKEPCGKAGDALFQRGGGGEFEEFGKVEDQHRRYGFVNGEDGMGNGLEAVIGLQVTDFGIVVAVSLQLDVLRFGQGGEVLAWGGVVDGEFLLHLCPRFLAVFVGLVIEGERLQVGEESQGGRPSFRGLHLGPWGFQRQRGESQHQMTNTEAVPRANGPDPARSLVGMRDTDDGGLIHVRRDFIIYLSVGA